MAEDKRCKIVVFGAFGAGKPRLLKPFDPQSRHVKLDCPGTHVTMLDFGRVQGMWKPYPYFWNPGQERFEFAREIIGRGMDGAILLVDATSPGR